MSKYEGPSMKPLDGWAMDRLKARVSRGPTRRAVARELGVNDYLLSVAMQGRPLQIAKKSKLEGLLRCERYAEVEETKEV